jgi:glycosyltransferase involved in cell wall biosynthesis
MQSVVALLGRGEPSADGVSDYCNNLRDALRKAGQQFEITTVRWFDRGWVSALAELWRAPVPARGDWALLQYTALAWSRRGFPFGAVATMLALRLRGVRCGVVMHEPWRQGILNPRPIDRLRGAFQDWTIRAIHALSSFSVFTLPLAHVRWLDPHDRKSVFIPLGPNVPEILDAPYPPTRPPGKPGKVVCVFCLSEPTGPTRELGDISTAARTAHAAGARLRVVFVGRGTDTGAAEIAAAFSGSNIETDILGLRSPEEIGHTIAASDVLLCVRGHLNLRRGSALAGIACGTPIVAYAGGEQGTPLMEAGVALAPLYDRDALGAELVRVLKDDALAQEMHRKNIEVEKQYFSWDTVAEQYLHALRRDNS